MCSIVGTFSTEKENINIQVNSQNFVQPWTFQCLVERHICERKKKIYT
jgi:hypothetical protein